MATVANGSRIDSVTSPYIHDSSSAQITTGLTNGETYYYIVTAINSIGESVPSAQVSAAASASTALDGAALYGTYCQSCHGALATTAKPGRTAAQITNAIAGVGGMSPNTLLRWTKDPEFDAAYQEARHTAFSQSIGLMHDASGAAVKTVLKIMLDSNVSAGTRLRAAEVVLGQGARAMEMEDLAARVAELERAVGSAQKSRQRSAILTWPSTKALPGPPPDAGADNVG